MLDITLLNRSRESELHRQRHADSITLLVMENRQVPPCSFHFWYLKRLISEFKKILGGAIRYPIQCFLNAISEINKYFLPGTQRFLLKTKKKCFLKMKPFLCSTSCFKLVWCRSDSSTLVWNKMGIGKNNSSLQNFPDSLSLLSQYSHDPSPLWPLKSLLRSRGDVHSFNVTISRWAALPRSDDLPAPSLTQEWKALRFHSLLEQVGEILQGKRVQQQPNKASKPAAGKARTAIKQWWAALLSCTPTPSGIKYQTTARKKITVWGWGGGWEHPLGLWYIWKGRSGLWGEPNKEWAAYLWHPGFLF